MQARRTAAEPTVAPPSQANPGSNVVTGEARRRAALQVLADYYRDVAGGRAPLD